jgi:hypothetical protein
MMDGLTLLAMEEGDLAPRTMQYLGLNPACGFGRELYDFYLKRWIFWHVRAELGREHVDYFRVLTVCRSCLPPRSLHVRVPSLRFQRGTTRQPRARRVRSTAAASRDGPPGSDDPPDPPGRLAAPLRREAAV